MNEGLIHPLYAEIVNNIGQSAGESPPILQLNIYVVYRVQYPQRLYVEKYYKNIRYFLQKDPSYYRIKGILNEGLVEGDGHFSNIQNIQIAFCLADKPLALFLQNKFSFGKVVKILHSSFIQLNV